jgi:hypothetical protein
MKNTFFHSNDDVLKIYHNRVSIKNTVIWKNENGPVIQWGWVPRNIDDVTVRNTDVIHNRMYWKDVKYNTCVFNSSSHYEDMGATDRADVATTVQNMTFADTRVEGAVNCAVRIFALSNTKNININGLAVDEWNDLDPAAQANKLKRYTDRAGTKVTIGNEVRDGNGLGCTTTPLAAPRSGRPATTGPATSSADSTLTVTPGRAGTPPTTVSPPAGPRSRRSTVPTTVPSPQPGRLPSAAPPTPPG